MHRNKHLHRPSAWNLRCIYRMFVLSLYLSPLLLTLNFINHLEERSSVPKKSSIGAEVFVMYLTTNSPSNNSTTNKSSIFSYSSNISGKSLLGYNTKDPKINSTFSRTKPGLVPSVKPTLNATVMSKEFPWMPDPCTKPRRNTRIEDLLCMKPPEFLPDYKNPCWIADGYFVCLPYFHMIGTCKSGTSDFFKRLLLHPDIVPNRGIFGKELWFWSWRRLFNEGKQGRPKLGMTLREFSYSFKNNIIQHEVDQHGNHIKITGIGDPMDLWDRYLDVLIPQNDPEAEELVWTTPYIVKHVNPGVKLLLMLRDPVTRQRTKHGVVSTILLRLYSHYFTPTIVTNRTKSAESFHGDVIESTELWRKCLQQHSLRHCIYSPITKKTLPTPLYASLYIVHIREWLKVFPRQQLLIIRNEDYSKDIPGTLRKVFDYLNISQPDESVFSQMIQQPRFYESRKKAVAGPMLNETKKLLVDFYRPYTEELAEFLHDERFAFRDQSFREISL